ncbi:MAG: DUF4304 domain-containing protein [Actinomycetota bacterium]|nr:DUF4304 domain-containing protein [Actinomycetota bacterium]
MPKGAKTILAEALDPLLPGFERNRWTWNRKRNNLVQVIEISGSKHRTGDMTIDWGVTPERWATLVYGEELPMYSSSHCAVFGRLGDFGGGDRWWDLEQVRTAVPPDMHSLLFEHLLPFLQRIDSPEQLLALVRRGYRPPRRRSDPYLDEHGSPWLWSWPRTKVQHQFVEAVLLAFVEGAGAALAALEEIEGWERADDVAKRLRSGNPRT